MKSKHELPEFILSEVEGLRTSYARRSRTTNSRARLFAIALCTAFAFLSTAAYAQSFFSLNTGDLKAELADARSEGKRGLMLFFEQEGCPGCVHMKQNVFNRKDVQSYYRQHFLSLAVDIHGAVQLRDFAGRDMTEKTYAQALKIRATPTFVFIDAAGNEVVRIVGPLRTAEEFLLLGRFVATGEYKSRSFTQFKLQKGS